jgi:hypothetical protein
MISQLIFNNAQLPVVWRFGNSSFYSTGGSKIRFGREVQFRHGARRFAPAAYSRGLPHYLSQGRELFTPTMPIRDTVPRAVKGSTGAISVSENSKPPQISETPTPRRDPDSPGFSRPSPRLRHLSGPRFQRS